MVKVHKISILLYKLCLCSLAHFCQNIRFNRLVIDDDSEINQFEQVSTKFVEIYHMTNLARLQSILIKAFDFSICHLTFAVIDKL